MITPGLGIGGEYPAGSVGAAEGTAELKSGTRNWWFIMFTNVMIDFGFVIGALVPMLAVSLLARQICTHFNTSRYLQPVKNT